jgi:hypothetical protein
LGILGKKKVGLNREGFGRIDFRLLFQLTSCVCQPVSWFCCIDGWMNRSHWTNEWDILSPPYATENRDSSVGIATGYGLDDRGVGVSVPLGSRIFSTSSRPALGYTQPPIQWIPGVESLDVKLTTQLQLIPRSRKRGSILVHPFPNTSS